MSSLFQVTRKVYSEEWSCSYSLTKLAFVLHLHSHAPLSSRKWNSVCWSPSGLCLCENAWAKENTHVLVPRSWPALSLAMCKPWHPSSPPVCLLRENPTCAFLQAEAVVGVLGQQETLLTFPDVAGIRCVQVGLCVWGLEGSTSDTCSESDPTQMPGGATDAMSEMIYSMTTSSSGMCVFPVWRWEKNPSCKGVNQLS